MRKHVDDLDENQRPGESFDLEFWRSPFGLSPQSDTRPARVARDAAQRHRLEQPERLGASKWHTRPEMQDLPWRHRHIPVPLPRNEKRRWTRRTHRPAGNQLPQRLRRAVRPSSHVPSPGKRANQVSAAGRTRHTGRWSRPLLYTRPGVDKLRPGRPAPGRRARGAGRRGTSPKPGAANRTV